MAFPLRHATAFSFAIDPECHSARMAGAASHDAGAELIKMHHWAEHLNGRGGEGAWDTDLAAASVVEMQE